MRPKGYIIDVPVTLSVAVRGTSLADAKRIAREFADTLSPSDQYCEGFTDTATLPPGASVTETTLESSQEDACELLDELAAEED